MKVFILVLLLAGVTSSITFAQTQTQTQPAQKSQTAPASKEKAVKAKAKATGGELEALLEQYYKDWNTLNVEAPTKYYAKDPSLVFYDILPLKDKGWKEYQTGVGK